LAHITGGGLLNLKRLTRLGFNLSDPLEPQEIFSVIQAEGVDVREMYKTFNMGMGFAIVAPQREASESHTSATALSKSVLFQAVEYESDTMMS